MEGTDPLTEAIEQRDRWIESYNQEHLRRLELEDAIARTCNASQISVIRTLVSEARQRAESKE